VDTGLDIVGTFDIYAYSATIPDTTLVAGSYLLSIVNNTAGDADDDWFWATSSQSGMFWFRNFEGDSWIAFEAELAFNISGPSSPAGVPDTGTSALLLGLGCIAVLVFRRGLSRAAAQTG